MARTTRYVMTLLTVTAAVVTVGEAFADGGTDLRIVVHVDNYAGIFRHDRLEAEDVATRIFAKAGVNLVWSTGNGKAEAPGLHVRVLLLPSDMAMRMINDDGLADNVFGTAVPRAGRAYIYTHKIANQALRHSVDFRLVLGLVLAHEVGHLVLPPDSHADNSIMRANMGIRSKSRLDFTTEQGAAIRSMLASVSRPRVPQATDAAFAGR